VLNIRSDIFGIQDAAGVAGNQVRVKVDTDIGAIGTTMIVGLVHLAYIDEDPLPFCQNDRVAVDLDFDSAFGNDAKLEFLMPVPGNRAQDVFTDLGGVNSQRKFEGAVLGGFFTRLVENDFIDLHRRASFSYSSRWSI